MLGQLDKYYGTMQSRDKEGKLNRGDWFRVDDDDNIIMVYLGDDLMLYVDESEVGQDQIEEKESNHSNLMSIPEIVSQYPLDFAQPMMGNLVEDGLMFP